MDEKRKEHNNEVIKVSVLICGMTAKTIQFGAFVF